MVAMRHWERLLFLVALLLLAFAGGVLVGKYQYWPYDTLNRANDAARAVWFTWFPDEVPVFNSPHRSGGVTRWERDAAAPGVTFIVRREDEAFGAVVVDMEGRQLHHWKVTFSDAFPGEAPHILARGPDERVGWHGVHLFENGDVLLNLEGGNFPFGGGLVLIDKDSRVKWALARNTHHDLEVQPDGTIVVLAHRYLEDGVPSCAAYARPPYLADEVLHVSADGEVLDSFSLAEAFCKSPFKWMMVPFGTYGLRPPARTDVEDLQHSNTVRVITPAQAAVFAPGEAGDYLVSFRNMNIVAVVDRDTRLVKWVLAGHFVRQHDPHILANGNLLIYDNLGGMIDGDRPQGRSRVLEIDPVTQQIVWLYEGGTAPQDRFDAAKGGKLQKLPNGNVLVTHSWQGRVFEVTGDANPRIVWEFVNLLEASEAGGRVGAIPHAQRIDPARLTFLGAATS